jgi:radical SAM/Cys-rich protein
MEAVLDALQTLPGCLVDVTGGAPELHPHFRRFVKAVRAMDLPVQVRTNLAVMAVPEHASLPEFCRDHQIKLVASLPCYTEENVDAQRGRGTYEQCIAMLKRLNDLGYGVEEALALDLVYNPAGPALPGDQAALEADYKRELADRFGIRFSRLLTIANAPIGRFRQCLRAQGREADYLQLLVDSFNPDTVERLMCRNQLSVGWDGTLYDCDFNLALGCRLNHGAPDHIRSFDPVALASRRIVTGDHCFACTAGAGSSCRGALRTADSG